MLASIQAYGDATANAGFNPAQNHSTASYLPTNPNGFINHFVFANGAGGGAANDAMAAVQHQATAMHDALAADAGAAGHLVTLSNCHKTMGMIVMKTAFNTLANANGDSYSAAKVTVVGGVAPLVNATQTNWPIVEEIWERVASRAASLVFMSALLHYADGTPWSEQAESMADRMARQFTCFGMPDMEAELLFIMEHWPAGANLGLLVPAITGQNAKMWCTANDCSVIGLKLPAKVRGTGDGENARSLLERVRQIHWLAPALTEVANTRCAANRVKNYVDALAAHNTISRANAVGIPNEWQDIRNEALTGPIAVPTTVAESRNLLVTVSRQTRHALIFLASAVLFSADKDWSSFMRYRKKHSHLSSYALKRCYESSLPFCTRCIEIVTELEKTKTPDTLALLQAAM